MVKKLYKLLIILSSILFLYLGFPTQVHAETENLVSYALKWVGNRNIPYVWGGGRQGETLESLAESGSSGVDCSSFVYLVYQHFGVTIPYQSDSIHDSPDGKKLNSIDEARPGDICWWDGHVALYIGGNKIVHTNTSDPKDDANLIHVSTIAGEDKDYRFPDEFIRFLSDEQLDSCEYFGDMESEATMLEVRNAISTGTLVTESDLNGMETSWSLEGLQSTVTMMTQDQLPFKDRLGLASIKDGIENSKLQPHTIVNVVSSALGYILMVYGLALGVGYIFDKANAFIDISILGLLSFGKWCVVEDEADIKSAKSKSSNVTFITKVGIIYRVIVVEVIAFVFIKGYISLYIMYLINKIT